MNKTPNGRFQFCENKAAISRNPVPASAACNLQDCSGGPHFTVIPIVGDGPTQSLSVDIVDKPQSKVPVPTSPNRKWKNRTWLKAVNKIRWTVASRTLGSPTPTGWRLISEIKYASTVTSICVLVTF